MKSTALHPPPALRQRTLIRTLIHLTQRPRKRILLQNASSVSLRLVKSCLFLVVISSLARNVHSTWSNSGLEETLLMHQNLLPGPPLPKETNLRGHPRLDRQMEALRMLRRLPRLLFPRLLLQGESEKPKAGSVQFVVNVSSIFTTANSGTY